MIYRSHHALPRTSVRARVATAAATLLVAGALACAPRAMTPTPAPAARATAFVPAPPPAPAAAEPSAEVVRAIEERVRTRMQAEMRAGMEARPVRNLAVRDRMEMSSTGYCLRGLMRTGVRTRDGMAAADPRVIPLGSVIRVTHPDGRPIGVFVVMDTGGAVRGNKIDIYMDSCREALNWGRRPVITEVLSVGRS